MLGSTLRACWTLLMLLPVKLWQCSPFLLLYAVSLGSGTVKCPFAAGAALLLTLAASARKNPFLEPSGSMFPSPCRPVFLQRRKSWITTKEQPQIFHI